MQVALTGMNNKKHNNAVNNCRILNSFSCWLPKTTSHCSSVLLNNLQKLKYPVPLNFNSLLKIKSR